LNVWTPGGTGLPVLAWLHGGGFSSGSGAEAWYDGALLAERGQMVVVTVNYRLGALGYLYLSPEFGPANLGLLDQIAALGWVRDNIAASGGDPARVTLAGQSAGALSALPLLGHPAAPGLFQQIILQSTPAGVPPYGPREAAEIGRRLLDVLGLRPDEAERLRTVPVPRLLAAQQETRSAHGRAAHSDPALPAGCRRRRTSRPARRSSRRHAHADRHDPRRGLGILPQGPGGPDRAAFRRRQPAASPTGPLGLRLPVRLVAARQLLRRLPTAWNCRSCSATWTPGMQRRCWPAPTPPTYGG
jgi:carboxylesterase type B